jgi:hypothetical protein
MILGKGHGSAKQAAQQEEVETIHEREAKGVWVSDAPPPTLFKTHRISSSASFTGFTPPGCTRIFW